MSINEEELEHNNEESALKELLLKNSK